MSATVKLHRVGKADAQQKAFIERACGLLQQAVNAEGFRRRMADAQYTATRHVDAEGHDTAVPREKVIEFILAGRESGTQDDGEIDLEVELAKLRSPGPFWGGVVGATELGELPIRTGRWFVNACMASGDAISLAAHFMHEWLHAAGFYHEGGNSARGDVPYVVGEIVQKVLEEDVPSAGTSNPALAALAVNGHA